MKSQEVIDFGWSNILEESKKDFSFVDVGIIASDGAQKTSGDLTMAELAHIMEFGVTINVTEKMRGFLGATGMHLKKETNTITIPSRPAIRGTFDEELNQLTRLADDLDKQIASGKMTRKKALTILGQTHQNQIQRAMSTSGKYKPNHPYTIEKKGSSQPLIDTGAYRQAINFEVG